MDKRFKKINHILSTYSLGNFSKRLEISDRLDEIDAFMAGINMLGEELKATTISRDYFNSIFHSVSDMVFVLDQTGLITDMNGAVQAQLGYTLEQLKETPFDHLLVAGYKPLLQPMAAYLKKTQRVYQKETLFGTHAGVALPVTVCASPLFLQRKRKKGFIVTVKDRTAQVETENLIIRTIIDTQEKERQRLAKDLHDSLGQQLAAIKFYISAAASSSKSKQQKDLLLKSSEALSKVQADMRNICFALMPKTLEEFGLVKAVTELCSQLGQSHPTRFHFSFDPQFPALSKELEIDLYRVIQEFIANALQHGRADDIEIQLQFERGKVWIVLRDNGRGFNPNETGGSGMGLQNVQSRVKSHNGELRIFSKKGRGAEFLVSVPLKDTLYDIKK